MDDDEKALLAESLDRLIGDSAPDQLDRSLEEFGWRELLADEPEAATALLLDLQGRHLAATKALDAVTLLAAGIDHTGDTAVVYPGLSAETPTSRAYENGGQVSLSVSGVIATRPAPPERILVPAVMDGDVVLTLAEWQGPEWPAAGVGIDPDAGFTRLDTTFDVAESHLLAESAPARWERMRAAGHRALAYELVAVGRCMLDLAIEHVTSREQFGRSLGSFQAVKHKLADVRLWQEAASFAADAAWEADRDTDMVDAAILAKLTANRFCRLAREHCQQVLGGMGFTWEHSFHRYARRALLLEPLLGDANALHAMLGSRIKATGTLPRLAPL